MRLSSLRASRGGFTLIEMLVVITIIAVLIGLLLPAVQKVRESANRTKCINNIKACSLAIVSYEEVLKRYPHGRLGCDGITNGPCAPSLVPLPPSRDRNGVSAFIQILPYVDQKGLYDTFDFDKPAWSGMDLT